MASADSRESLIQHEHSKAFIEALKKHFPTAIPETVFVGQSYEKLYEHGFDEANSIACVSVCRDELSHPLVGKICSAWGESFNFSSLAGMLTMGRTGFGAALAHAPDEWGRPRYCFYGLPHIGIDSEGNVGKCGRPGMNASSGACGALSAFVAAVKGGQRSFDLDMNDVEQSLLSQALMKRLKADEVPDLVRVTRLAQELILEALEALIADAIDPSKADYAVFTGLQVHGTKGRDFVVPGTSYAVWNGERTDIEL